MQDQLQKDLNTVVGKLRSFGPKISRTAKQDLNEAAKVIVQAAKANAPQSAKPHQGAISLGHKSKRITIKPGNLKRSIRRLALRRVKSAAIVGIKLGGAVDGWYGRFVEQGTKYQRAQYFMERAKNSAGPIAQDIAIRLISKRIDDLINANFK